MKKTIALILALVLCLSLCACGGGNGAPETTEAGQVTEAVEVTQEPATEETEPPAEEVIYKLGDVIETELFKITPGFTGYARELANWPDKDYMTPAGKFSGSSPYSAGAEKTAMYGEVLIEYVGNEKSNVMLNMNISADYDDGYIFGDAYVDMGYCVSVEGDWKYNGQMIFEPLSSATTRILRYCIEVPEQVEVNTDKPLLVTFFVNGEPFVFNFRSEDVLGSDYDPRAEFYQPVDEETKAKIVAYLKANGLEEMGWYAEPVKAVGIYTFKFKDNTVTATLPINSSYQYDFSGTYEVFSGTILITWDFGKQMHLDYTFDGKNLDVISFEHDR